MRWRVLVYRYFLSAAISNIQYKKEEWEKDYLREINVI